MSDGTWNPPISTNGIATSAHTTAYGRKRGHAAEAAAATRTALIVWPLGYELSNAVMLSAGRVSAAFVTTSTTFPAT